MIDLRARFLLVTAFVVLATAASGYAGVVSFARVSSVVGERVQDSAAAIALVEDMERAIEAESDAHLDGAQERLVTARARFESTFASLPPVMDSAEEAKEREAAASLRAHVDAFRRSGDPREAHAALADCALLRRLHFDSTQRAAGWARDEARAATIRVSVLSLSVLALAVFVAWRHGRRVVWPIREVSSAVDSIRHSEPTALLGAGAGAGIAGMATAHGPYPAPSFVDRELRRLLSNVHELARLDEMKSELLAVASHELKTPLTTLRITLGLLDEGAAALSPQQRELLGMAQDGVNQLGATVDEFLDLTRIEAGKLDLAATRLDLGRLASETATSLATRFEETGVSLCVDVEPCLVRGDEARLRMVMTNLMTNALKYTPRGSKVTIGVSAGDASESRASLWVSDEGRGILPEHRERIFEKFFRVEHVIPQADQGVRGMGVGLYLCRQILLSHGGTITCEPNDASPVHGARFVVSLPRVEAGTNRRTPATQKLLL